MKDAELVQIFDSINKETNNKKIHEHYQKKIKKLYQELIKYKYEKKTESRKKDTAGLNENESAIKELNNMGQQRPNAFVNKKIATRALIAQDKLSYYGQALGEEDIDMTWIQLCTLLKVTEKKQVLKTVKGYHDKLPNYLNLKSTLITLMNTVDPLGVVVPMSSRNTDECLKYTDRLIHHITKIAEHTARTKPTLLTPVRDPLPIRNVTKKSSVLSLSEKSMKSSRSLNKSIISETRSSKKDSKSDIQLSVSHDKDSDDVSITSSMIDRIIQDSSKPKQLSNASFGSSQNPELESFIDNFARQSVQDETLNTDFLNDISTQLRKGHNGSSVSDL